MILNKISHPGLKDYVAKACGPYAYIKRAPQDNPNYKVPELPKNPKKKKAEDLKNHQH